MLCVCVVVTLCVAVCVCVMCVCVWLSHTQQQPQQVPQHRKTGKSEVVVGFGVDTVCVCVCGDVVNGCGPPPRVRLRVGRCWLTFRPPPPPVRWLFVWKSVFFRNFDLYLAEMCGVRTCVDSWHPVGGGPEGVVTLAFDRIGFKAWCEKKKGGGGVEKMD